MNQNRIPPMISVTSTIILYSHLVAFQYRLTWEIENCFKFFPFLVSESFLDHPGLFRASWDPLGATPGNLFELAGPPGREPKKKAQEAPAGPQEVLGGSQKAPGSPEPYV